MKNDKYVITTDYKSGGLFSAVFSFECDKESFASMEKSDLLHSYMVSQIILSFNDEDYESNFSQPYILSDAVEAIKNIVNSVKKQAGGNKFNQKLEKTLKAIEDQFPEETAQIKSLVKDDTNILCTSFFAPQILNSLIQEYELSDCKKCKNLVAINLTEFVNTSASKRQAIIIDFINAWGSWTPKLPNKLSEKGAKKNEELKSMIKQTLQLTAVSNGELAQYIELKNKNNNNVDNNEEEGKTS